MDPYILAVIVFVGMIAWYFWSHRKFYALAFQLPGPPVLPIFGNGLSFFCDTKDLLPVILRLTKPYSSPLRLWLGPRLVIFVKDPHHLQTIMQSSKMAKKSFVYSFLEPFMGKGLFTSSGIQHKNHRKILQPLFSPKYVEGYSYLFQKHANKLIEILKSHEDKEEFDILHELHESAFEATMDILLEDKNDHTYDYKDMPHYVRRFYHIFSQRVIKFWYHWNFIYKTSNYYKEQEYMVKIATTLTEEITNARVPEILNRLESTSSEQVDNGNTRVPSMLEIMMGLVYENPELLSENEFRDHMMTFVATSQDTQSSAIAFTLMMLGMHPNIQETVVKELQTALDGKEYLNYDDLGKLNYMEMSIKEAMRLFPLGPFLIRDTTEDFQLDKWTLPKGCSVVLGVYNVQRDPNLWEKPEEFYPEHFLPEVASKRHLYAFLPFSAGPRRCIAQQYSYVNMKIIISTILQKFIIHCAGSLKDLNLMTDVSIRPLHGYNIKITNRN